MLKARRALEHQIEPAVREHTESSPSRLVTPHDARSRARGAFSRRVQCAVFRPPVRALSPIDPAVLCPQIDPTLKVRPPPCRLGISYLGSDPEERRLPTAIFAAMCNFPKHFRACKRL